MSLLRLAVLLLAAIVAGVTVVVVRTETTRVERRISEIDRDITLLKRLIREKELDLARLSSPADIRSRWTDVAMGDFSTTKPAEKPPAKRSKPKRP